MPAHVADETKTNSTNMEDENEAKRNDLLGKVGEQTKNVLNQASQAASDIKTEALDLFGAAFDADKEAKAEEAESKENTLLDQAGKHAKNGQVQGGKAASGLFDQAGEQAKNVQTQAGKQAKDVQAQAGKAASDVKTEALNLFNDKIEKKDQADKVAEEATVASEENERKIDQLLDQAGEVANQALNQAATTASAVKEALVPFDNKVDEIKDETFKVANEADDNEPKTTDLSDAGEATKPVRMKDALDGAGKTVSDAKAEAIKLVHKVTEPQSEESASGLQTSPDKPAQ